MSNNRKEVARLVIKKLGGPAKVAELAGFDKRGGTQRVQNWLDRGIPPSILLENPTILATARELENPSAG